VNETTTVVVRTLGQLWSGGTAAKGPVTLTVGNGPWQFDVDPDNDEEILDRLLMNEGDLHSAVLDVVVVETTVRHLHPNEGGAARYVTTVTERAVSTFTEEEDMAWSDCFSEEWEDA
jgi:hypothetical protein